MQTHSSIRPGTVFQIARELRQLPESLKLRNLEWGLLFAITGEHTVAQLGTHFGLAPAERDAAFARLQAKGLIQERELSLSQYLRAAATLGDDQPKSLARFLRAGSALGATAPAAAVPAPATPGPAAKAPAKTTPTTPTPTVKAPRASEEAIITRAVPVPSRGDISFQPLSSPPKPAAPATPARAGTAPASPRLSLKALMRFILDRAGDLNAGQLDIYRVFIRVNTRLLKRNGITTLRFEDDHLISDPELQAALTSSLRKTLGLGCPREVFV